MCSHHPIHHLHEAPERQLLVRTHDHVHRRAQIRHALHVTFEAFTSAQPNRNKGVHGELHRSRELATGGRLTKLFLVEVVGEQDGGEALDVLVRRRLRADIGVVRGHGRIPRRSGRPRCGGGGLRRGCSEQRVRAIGAATVDVYSMSFLYIVRT
jgi:hypothetical protein